MRNYALIVCLFMGLSGLSQSWEPLTGFETPAPGENYIQRLQMVDGTLFLVGAHLDGFEDNVVLRALDEGWEQHPWTARAGSGVAYGFGITGESLFLGGNFSGINADLSIDQLASMPIDGASTYAPVGIETPAINTLLTDENGVVLAGSIWTDGTIESNIKIARYHNQELETFGTPFGFHVNELVHYNGGLAMAGLFGGYSPTLEEADFQSCPNVAFYTNGEWSCATGGLNERVTALATDGEMLYLGGNFTLANGGAISCPRVVAWDGSNWQTLGEGLSTGQVECLAVYHGQLYAGGNQLLGNHDLVYYNGASWEPVAGADQITDGAVHALLVHESDLFVAGKFVQIGELTSHGLVRYHLDEDEVISHVREASPPHELRCFPNPSTGFIELRFEASQFGQRVEVVGMNGNIVTSFKATTTPRQLNTSDWSSGTYIVRCGNARAQFMVQ